MLTLLATSQRTKIKRHTARSARPSERRPPRRPRRPRPARPARAPNPTKRPSWARQKRGRGLLSSWGVRIPPVAASKEPSAWLSRAVAFCDTSNRNGARHVIFSPKERGWDGRPTESWIIRTWWSRSTVGALRDSDAVLDLGLLAHLVYLVFFFWCFGKGGESGKDLGLGPWALSTRLFFLLRNGHIEGSGIPSIIFPWPSRRRRTSVEILPPHACTTGTPRKLVSDSGVASCSSQHTSQQQTYTSTPRNHSVLRV